jgi:hypothetical protein
MNLNLAPKLSDAAAGSLWNEIIPYHVTQLHTRRWQRFRASGLSLVWGRGGEKTFVCA